MKTYHILFFTHLLSILFTFSPRTQISVLNTMLVKAPPVSHVHVHKIYKTGVAFFVKGFLLASVPTFKIAKTENHCFFYGIFPIREMILCLQSSIFSRNLTEIEQLLPQAALLVSRSKRGRALASLLGRRLPRHPPPRYMLDFHYGRQSMLRYYGKIGGWKRSTGVQTVDHIYGPYTETAVQSNLFTTATLGRAKVCGSCQ